MEPSKSWQAFLSLAMLFLTALLTLVYLYLPFNFFQDDTPDKLFASPHYTIKPDPSMLVSKKPEHLPPLHTAGRNIVDKHGQNVHLKAINWYGASDIDFIPSGLEHQHRDNISALIKRMGFNTVRLPYSDEMVLKRPLIPPDKLTANPDLAGRDALDVYRAVVESMTSHGLMVIPNNHITQATWCCGANLCDAQWRNDWLGPLCRVRQTEEQWIANWKAIMRPLASNRLVIGADLRNEVRALWGTLRWETWAMAAERCAEELLDINPEWLMVVEGISSANDLSGVKERRVELSIENKVVYSAHVYAWSGWGQRNPYSQSSYDDFAAAMRRNWAFIVEDDVAPVWLGEFGAPDYPSRGDVNYWKHLMSFLRELNLGFGYWAVNPRKPMNGESESYGLVDDQWDKVVWDYRLEDLTSLGLNTSLVFGP